MKTRHRGFTLIELMIVIAIIAILAAIGDEKQIATAMEEYAVDNQGQYTSTLPVLYLAITPKDPVNNTAYVITAVAGAYGSYQITDTGGHDQTTMGILNLASGTTCGQATCTSVLYNQNSGLQGK